MMILQANVDVVKTMCGEADAQQNLRSWGCKNFRTKSGITGQKTLGTTALNPLNFKVRENSLNPEARNLEDEHRRGIPPSRDS